MVVNATATTGGRSIVIFSDGTGQDGGVRPEQRLSNVYKLYRAARVGPDNSIDPNEQVAFYDPGLGTDTSAVGLTGLRRSWTRLMSSITGRGITTNIADCYEFIINHWRPGDRIWLFGFSRGAYTIRCLANVLMYCGVPTRTPDGPLPKFRYQIREIAERAVIRVYEHGAGHTRDRYESERWELAMRFRHDFGSGGDDESNAAPYFIGAFDAVASLGAKGWLRLGLTLFAILLLAIPALLVAAVSHWAFGLPWPWAVGGALILIGLYGLWSYLRTALKIMWPPLPGKYFPTVHLAQWSGKNFDRLLSKSVAYARHAIAIDENRADFPRLAWGTSKTVVPRAEVVGAAKPFIQMWFAGNHSDIGGSYPEAEPRLSDIALGWMVEEARSVPHPLIVTMDALRLYPDASGLQHDEVQNMQDTIRKRTPFGLRWLTRHLGWGVQRRDPKTIATLHPSVIQRFVMDHVPTQGGDRAYRPEALCKHEDCKLHYTAVIPSPQKQLD